MEKETIVVNGTIYDATTGKPIEGQAGQSLGTPTQKSRHAAPSHVVHQRMEMSRTAGRRTTAAPAQSLIQKKSETRRVMQPTGAANPAIVRFAPQPSKAMHRPRMMSDIRPATPHPLAQKAEQRMQQTQPHRAEVAAIKPSAILKKEAIDEALSKAPEHHSSAKPMKRARRTPRFLSVASTALSLLLLAGYLTYINLPNLSVRVAANQAGIEASYPGYRPDGYRLAGVNYDKGSVSLKFAANAGPQNFTITQQQTSWDSTAVKENYVKTNWGDDVTPYSERGLTIYAHEGNAVWVNGGILYMISGDAPLSASQVRSIAVSL